MAGLDPSGRSLETSNEKLKGEVAGVEVDDVRRVPPHVDPDNEESQEGFNAGYKGYSGGQHPSDDKLGKQR